MPPDPGRQRAVSVHDQPPPDPGGSGGSGGERLGHGGEIGRAVQIGKLHEKRAPPMAEPLCRAICQGGG